MNRKSVFYVVIIASFLISCVWILTPILTYETKTVEFTFTHSYIPNGKTIWTLRDLEPDQTVVLVDIWTGNELARTQADSNGTARLP